MCWAGALRGSPASTTATRRRARARTRAADRPAAPPPITTTSYSFMARSVRLLVLVLTTMVAIPGNRAWNGLHVRPRRDRGCPRPRGPAAQGHPQGAGRHADRPGRAHGHLQEHAVAARERAAAAQPGAVAAAGAGLPRAARRPGGRAGGRRPADPPQAPQGQRPDGASAHPAAQRRPGLEDRDPRAADDAAAPRPRRLRVALRAVGTDAPGPRRPRPGAGCRRGRRVRHPAAPLVRVDGRGRAPRC